MILNEGSKDRVDTEVISCFSAQSTALLHCAAGYVCEPVQTLPHVSEILRTFKKQARAMAQAAGGQPGTAVGCTRVQSSPCRISGPQTDNGTGCFSEKFGRRASIIPLTLSVHSLLDYQHIIILATDSVFVKHLNVCTYTVHR